jgi:hypothetical protein
MFVVAIIFDGCETLTMKKNNTKELSQPLRSFYDICSISMTFVLEVPISCLTLYKQNTHIYIYIPYIHNNAATHEQLVLCR